MKKVLVLSLMLMLVFGSMALASVQHKGDDEIDVNVSVAGVSTVTVSESIDFGITELDSNENLSTVSVVNVTANTPINVKFEENISSVLDEHMGSTRSSDALVWRYAIHTFDETEGALSYDNWIVSPNITVDPWDWNPLHQYGAPDGMGKLAPIEDAGSHTFDVSLHATWRSKNNAGQALDWWELEGIEELSGTITILIEAQ